MQALYKIMSYVWMFKALKRGPASFMRQRARSYANKKFNQALRKVLKP